MLRAGVQHAAGFLNKKAAAGPGDGQPFRRKHLVGRIHRVGADAKLGRHGAPPRQSLARLQGTGADILRKCVIELLIQRHFFFRMQFNHGGSPLRFIIWHHKK